MAIAGIVVACIAVVIIITVITVEILVRLGKLPKLAARRNTKKERRMAKKEAKRVAKNGSSPPNDCGFDVSGVPRPEYVEEDTFSDNELSDASDNCDGGDDEEYNPSEDD